MPVPRAAISAALTGEIAACRACPRLVAWRETVAREKRAAYRDEDVLGAGRSRVSATRRARLLLVGLAPAAHGGNRTGRVFTGDRSGDFLFALAASHRVREPSGVGARRRRPAARDAYVAAAVRCAPPANKPTPAERDDVHAVPRTRAASCCARVRVIVALGAFGYEATWSALRSRETRGGVDCCRPGGPRFAHGLEVPCGRVTIVVHVPSEPAEHVHAAS